jgi:CDP-diacylglycerol--serine O-phosphatidyltransferase
MVKKRFKIKNILTITLFRIILAVIISSIIYFNKQNIALYLFVLAAAISFMEGLLVKKNKIKSHLRSILDPFADKLLINIVAISLFLKGQFPYGVMIAYLTKDLIVTIGGLSILIKNIKTTFKTNAIDKIAVFIQLLTLLTVLMGRLDYILIWTSIVLITISLISTLARSGIKVVKHKTDLEEIRFTKIVKLPDFLTLLNILMGFAAILFTINNRYDLAIIAFLLAVLFDYLDGKVARWIKREGEFGKQLDSLADTISFGLAPAIFGFSLIQTNFALIVFALFIFAGVLRLARYNIMDFSGEFAGMPITVNGVLIPIVYIIGVPTRFYPYIYLLLAILMVSPLKFKKI